ncbi:MAG: dTMP kinase [Pseudoclavibacter sp.]|nr:dTMP kinase [Pseudoclavibacter sp.]
MTGLFITLEGGDGAGKTTQADLLERWLRQECGRPVVRSREPGGTRLGERLRELLLHHDEEGEPIDPRAEALLYAADRAQNVAAVVRPALERGEVVVQDRYLDSSIVYQGSGRELAPHDVRGLSMWGSRELLPELTVLLDLDAAEAARRRAGRERSDRLEDAGEAFHERVRAAYRLLAEAEPGRFLVVDGSRSVEEIARRIRERVAGLLAERA